MATNNCIPMLTGLTELRIDPNRILNEPSQLQFLQTFTPHNELDSRMEQFRWCESKIKQYDNNIGRSVHLDLGDRKDRICYPMASPNKSTILCAKYSFKKPIKSFRTKNTMSLEFEDIYIEMYKPRKDLFEKNIQGEIGTHFQALLDHFKGISDYSIPTFIRLLLDSLDKRDIEGIRMDYKHAKKFDSFYFIKDYENPFTYEGVTYYDPEISSFRDKPIYNYTYKLDYNKTMELIDNAIRELGFESIL